MAKLEDLPPQRRQVVVNRDHGHGLQANRERVGQIKERSDAAPAMGSFHQCSLFCCCGSGASLRSAYLLADGDDSPRPEDIANGPLTRSAAQTANAAERGFVAEQCEKALNVQIALRPSVLANFDVLQFASVCRTEACKNSFEYAVPFSGHSSVGIKTVLRRICTTMVSCLGGEPDLVQMRYRRPKPRRPHSVHGDQTCCKSRITFSIHKEAGPASCNAYHWKTEFLPI